MAPQGVTHTPFPVATELLELPSPPPPPMPRSSAALVQAWQGRSTELSTTLSLGRGAGGGGLERPPEKSRQVPALSPPECSFKAILDPKMPP